MPKQAYCSFHNVLAHLKRIPGYVWLVWETIFVPPVHPIAPTSPTMEANTIESYFANHPFFEAPCSSSDCAKLALPTVIIGVSRDRNNDTWVTYGFFTFVFRLTWKCSMLEHLIFSDVLDTKYIIKGISNLVIW